jgi:hypothetical protein
MRVERLVLQFTAIHFMGWPSLRDLIGTFFLFQIVKIVTIVVLATAPCVPSQIRAQFLVISSSRELVQIAEGLDSQRLCG